MNYRLLMLLYHSMINIVIGTVEWVFNRCKGAYPDALLINLKYLMNLG